MSQLTIPTLDKVAAEFRTYVFDFSRYAEIIDGQTLVTPTVPAVSGLTFGSPTVTAADIEGIPAGKGVQVNISVGTAGTSYTVDCRCTTSGGATLVRRMTLRVL